MLFIGLLGLTHVVNTSLPNTIKFVCLLGAPSIHVSSTRHPNNVPLKTRSRFGRTSVGNLVGSRASREAAEEGGYAGAALPMHELWSHQNRTRVLRLMCIFLRIPLISHESERVC